jgi:hypothetical protein
LGAPPPVTQLQPYKNNNLGVTKSVTDENRSGYTSVLVTDTGVRLEIEQIHLVIEWIIAVGVVSALKGAGKLDFFERVNGQNL